MIEQLIPTEMETTMFKIVSKYADKVFGTICVIDGVVLNVSAYVECASPLVVMFIGAVSVCVGALLLLKK